MYNYILLIVQMIHFNKYYIGVMRYYFLFVTIQSHTKIFRLNQIKVIQDIITIRKS